MDVVRPTSDHFEEALAVLRASESAVYGDSDWTAADLREEWDGLDLEHDAWLVEVDGRIAGVAHFLERKGGRYFGDAYVHPELTGATRLYERADVRVLWQADVWQKELRPA